MGQWYQSRKGQISTLIGIILFGLDAKGRLDSALAIYDQAPSWLLSISPYIAPFFFALAIVFFEMRRRSLPTKKKTRSGWLTWQVAAYIGTIAVFVVASLWLVTRLNLTAEIRGSMIGELRAASPAASLVLRVKLRNVGPPTTTSDWSARVKLRDGEIANGMLFEKWITAYADVQGGIDPPSVEIKADEFISRKTATTPIPTGGSETGPLAFLFVGYTRDHIDEPGNVLTLEFKDAHRHVYTTDHMMTAKKWVFIQTPAPQEPMQQ